MNSNFSRLNFITFSTAWTDIGQQVRPRRANVRLKVEDSGKKELPKGQIFCISFPWQYWRFFTEKMPQKIKIISRKMTTLDWLIVWLLTTLASIQNFTTKKPRGALSQQQFTVINPNPLQQIFLLLSYFISPTQSWLLAIFPLGSDTQHTSSRSRQQASFLLEGITESSSFNGQSKPFIFCPSSSFSSPVHKLQCLGKGTEIFVLICNFAAPGTPTGLWSDQNTSGWLKNPDDFEAHPPNHPVPLHCHTATANLFRLFRQETFIFTLCFSSKCFCSTHVIACVPALVPHTSIQSHYFTKRGISSLGEPVWPGHQNTATFLRRKKWYCDAVKQLLASCMGSETSIAIILLRWHSTSLCLSDCSPGHVFSMIRHFLTCCSMWSLVRYH